MPRHCPGCSHPTICRTHGCAADEARENKRRLGLPTDEELIDQLMRALRGMVDVADRLDLERPTFGECKAMRNARAALLAAEERA